MASSPGHCAVVFRTDAIDDDAVDWQRAAGQAHAILTAAVRRIAEECSPDLRFHDLTTYLKIWLEEAGDVLRSAH